MVVYETTPFDFGYLALLLLTCLPILIRVTIAGMKKIAHAVVTFPKPNHRCKSCGYDLRATPNLCPECGTPSSKSE